MAAPEEPESLEQVKMKCITSPLCLSSTHTHTHTLSLHTHAVGLGAQEQEEEEKEAGGHESS